MKPSQRLLPLFFVTIFTLFTFVFAQEAVEYVDEKQKVLSKEHGLGNAQLDEYSLAVHDALTILHRIKAPKRLVPLAKPKGFIGSAIYYGKELFNLLFMNSPSQTSSSLSTKPQKLSTPLSKAVQLLEAAAAHGNADALFLLGEMNFHGNFTHPRDFPQAFAYYHALAQQTGNASAQHMVGFLYATGYGGAVQQDQAKAVLYHTFAAEGGDIRSQMTVAYRHHQGIAVPRDCETAVQYYKKVADKAIEHLRSGPPGGHMMVKESYRIADDVGGVFGEGASVSSSGANAKIGGPSSDVHANLEHVLEYMDLMSRKGEIKAAFSLGKLHYEGSRNLKRDVRLAKQYFMDVARRYWTKDGKVKQEVSVTEERIASKAAGYLGRMFLRGEGMPQSYDIARIWFKRGILNGDSISQYSMGLMYLHGLGVEKNPVKAAEYFAPAADQDLASAQVQLGILFLDQGDVETALKYFDLAARNGHIEAFYYLAELIHKGIGREKSCGEAAIFYKIVAEKAEIILASFPEANAAYEEGNLETALIDYMMAAEQGIEAGQANVAYLLDQARPTLPAPLRILPTAGKKSSLLPNPALALIYWTRSSRQSNIDSMVKMGDYYHYGIGTKADQEKAVACYQAAAETMLSAQAHWNLGWMHENGVGLKQDFHLAKRFYDQALETNREAYLPVRLSLIKLRLRSWWNGISGGKVKGIKDEEVKKKWSFNEWIANFLESSEGYWDTFELDDYDQEPMPGGDWAGYDDIDEGIIDSLIILGLAAVLAFLVIYRQQRALRNRRAQEQAERELIQGGNAADPAAAAQAPGQENEAEEDDVRGLFPPPNDPNFNDWVAGGVGH